MGHWDRGYVVGMGGVGEWPARWCWGGAKAAEPRARALSEARGRGRRRRRGRARSGSATAVECGDC